MSEPSDHPPLALRDPYYKGRTLVWLGWECAFRARQAAEAYERGDQDLAATCAWLAIGLRLELVARKHTRKYREDRP